MSALSKECMGFRVARTVLASAFRRAGKSILVSSSIVKNNEVSGLFGRFRIVLIFTSVWDIVVLWCWILRRHAAKAQILFRL